MIEFKVNGFADLEKALRDLPDKIAKKAMASASMAGARVLANAVKDSAPVASHIHWRYDYRRKARGGGRKGKIEKFLVYPGNIKFNVRVKRARTSGGQFEAMYSVGPMKRGGTPSTDPFYWRFVEFGTSKMAARPFLRPAFDAKRNEIIEAMRARLAERIDREVAKLQ